jgi:hypothetical protein
VRAENLEGKELLAFLFTSVTNKVDRVDIWTKTAAAFYHLLIRARRLTNVTLEFLAKVITSILEMFE